MQVLMDRWQFGVTITRSSRSPSAWRCWLR